MISYQQRLFAAITLVYALFPSDKYGKYKSEGGGGDWSLVDLRNVCSYFLRDITSIRNITMHFVHFTYLPHLQ
jgi:hypothetical protein